MYYLLNRQELVKEDKVYMERKRFQTLKEAIGWAMKNGGINDWIILEEVEDWNVVKVNK